MRFIRVSVKITFENDINDHDFTHMIFAKHVCERPHTRNLPGRFRPISLGSVL